MKHGFNRFNTWLEQVKTLMNKARNEKDPAMWLLRNNARTPFFMLEALARLYAGIHNRKSFNKLKEHFKAIEDGIGLIDHYNSLSEAFGPDKRIAAEYSNYFKSMIEKSALDLNRLLEKKGWLSGKERRINKITGKLHEMNWQNPAAEVEAIREIYDSSVSDITQFAVSTKFHFDNVEEDVHELRRRLRWLSIYPQALQGTIQYGRRSVAPAHLKKYLTKEIVESPYNKLPSAGSNTALLLLNRNYFLSLSWMIDRLGKLKDEGLLLTGIIEAMNQIKHGSGEDTLAEAKTMTGSGQRNMQKILSEAEAITRTFFKEDILNNLVIRK